MENNIEDTTKRTIEEVYDLKDGVFIEAKEFFSRSESEIIAFRKHLEEAIQLNQPRFVCSHCRQMVKISGKSTVKGKVSFFSHLHDSDDCDIKTTTQLSKEEIEARKYGMVGESERHKRLKTFISTYLENCTDVSDVQVSKRIKSDIPYLNWRCPDVTAQYKGKKLVFELQLSTTFLSVIVDRDIFYRLNNYFVIWVFNFDNMENKLTLDNLLAKDIYYANKRNVFILDEEAMDKSKEENKLYFSVKWLDDNNKFTEKRLVTLDELSFDDNSCKPYYYDAESLYYINHPEEQLRVSSLERSRQQVLDSLMKKKKDDEEKKRRIEEAQAKKREEMRQIGLVATPYMKSKKWGYEYNDTKLTLPIYTSASEINSEGFGYVTKNRRTGLVDQCGEEILPCQFKSIYPLSNGCFLVDEEGYWRIYNGDSIDKVKKDDNIIRHFLNENFVSVTIRRETDSITMIVRRDGNIKQIDAISDFKGKIANVTLKGRWQSGRSWYSGGYWHYEKKSYKQGESRLFTFNGFFLKETTDLNKKIIPAVAFKGGVGLLNNKLIPISSFDYSALSLLDEENVKVKKEWKYGLLCINKETHLFEETIPCQYDNLELSEFGNIKVCNGNKWGVINYNNITVVPIQYESIEEITENKIYVKKNSRKGACDYTGKEIIEDRKPFSSNLEIGKFFEKYGIIDAHDNNLLDFEYDSIILIDDKCIKADHDLFKLDGELLCSNISEVNKLKNGMIICKGIGSLLVFDNKLNKLLGDYPIRNISDFVDGKAVVELLDGKKGYITEDGEIITECVEPLTGNLSKQKIMGRWGVKTDNNEWLYPAKYDEIIAVGADSFILVTEYSITIINKLGVLKREINDVRYISQINDSLLKLRSKGLYGICNTEGELVLNCRYTDISEAPNGYIITQKTEKIGTWRSFEYYVYGLLAPNGKTIIEASKYNITIQDNCIHTVENRLHVVYDMSMNKLCEYYHAESLKSGFKKISLSRFGNGKYTHWGVVNSEWRLIVPCHFEEINMLSDDWFSLKINGKWGCVSSDLSQSYPCVYPNICINMDNLPSVKIGSKIIPCSDFVERKRLEINHSYNAIIDEIRDYGYMVKIESHKCLLHISELRKHGIKMSKYKVGDNIDVLVTSFDKNKKRYSLSIK